MSEAHEASQEVRQLVVMGRLLLIEERLDEALVLADRATAFTITSPTLQSRAWRLKNSILFQLRRYDEALAAANRVVALQPNSPTSYMQRAAVLSALTHHLEALADCEHAIALAPHHAVVWRAQGDMLYQEGRFSQALHAHDHALALDSHDARAWVGRAETLAQLGRHQAAVAACDRALQLRENVEDVPRGSATARTADAYVLLVKMHSLSHLRKWQDALEVSEQAAALAPSNADTWTVMGVALHHLKRFEEAVAAERKVVNLHPTDGHGWLNLALTLVALDRMQEALEVCDRGMQRAADVQPLREQRALILAVLFARGIITMQSPYLAEPELDVPAAWTGAANHLRHCRQPESALKACDEGLRRCPTYMELYSIKTWVLKDLHRYRDMARMFGVALRASTVPTSSTRS
jgi:tetratricopeptide (TPR) repeat protein